MTTTQEQPVTFLTFPSESILHKPAHSPKVFALGKVKRLTMCSAQMALTGLTYSGWSRSFARAMQHATQSLLQSREGLMQDRQRQRFSEHELQGGHDFHDLTWNGSSWLRWDNNLFT